MFGQKHGWLVAAFVVLAGCAPPDEAWNGYAFGDAGGWEAPPPRSVPGPDPSEDAGTDDGGGTTGGGTKNAGDSCAVSKNECPAGMSCYPSVFAEGEENGGLCQKVGKSGYKGRCSLHGDCARGLLCSPNGAEGCRWACDPSSPACQDGGMCISLPKYNHTGYCAPPM